ncbi:MAG: FMN-dependent NADH-azoreductase [Bacilli bacterium]
MSNILVIHGSLGGLDGSVSTRVATKFVDSYKSSHSNVNVVEIDANKVENISFTKSILAGAPTNEDLKVLDARKKYLDIFLNSDIIVIATPMWNFGLPGKLKEFLDVFMVAGVTFSYLDKPNANGDIYEGLIHGKKLFVVQSMGGFNTGFQDVAFAQIERMFNFVGLNDIVYFPVQGGNIPGSEEEPAKSVEVVELAKTF